MDENITIQEKIAKVKDNQKILEDIKVLQLELDKAYQYIEVKIEEE